MYRDLNASYANHIEDKLGVLENKASQVVRRIKDAQKSGTATVDLTRIQLNDLRKFLFIMKYRNNKFWKKYSCTMNEYSEVDKVYVQAFMRLRGFTKPAEVWLHTLKVILDTPIDERGKWQSAVCKNGFSHDAMWFVYHMTESYLSFCQPSHPDDEFIITENGFGINEGPTMYNYGMDPQTGLPTAKSGSYTEYHKLAPLSPKLLLVLRSNCLRKGNEAMLRAMRARPEVPDSPSLFENLQLDPATPSYDMQELINLGMKDNHTFSFKIQKISTEYTDLFNTVMLEEARASITWSSDIAMRKTLKAYLENPKFKPHPGLVLELKCEAKLRLLGILDGTAPKVSPLLQGNFIERIENEISQKPELEVYFLLGKHTLNVPSNSNTDISCLQEENRQIWWSTCNAPPKSPANEHSLPTDPPRARNMSQPAIQAIAGTCSNSQSIPVGSYTCTSKCGE
jgi:hypothetical protein